MVLLLIRIALTIWDLLCFHTEFEIACFYFCEEQYGIL